MRSCKNLQPQYRASEPNMSMRGMPHPRQDLLSKKGGRVSSAPMLTGCVDHADSLQNLLEKRAGAIHFRLAKYLCWRPLFNDDSLIGEEHRVGDLTREGHFVGHQDGS